MLMANKLIFMLIIALSASAMAVSADNAMAAEDSKAAVSLGVFPHLPPRELEKVYAPIVARLAEALGRKVVFRSSSNYKKFMAKLDKETFDIVFVQPFDYVHIADKFGYIPLATRAESLATVVVVPVDSEITQLASLKGKKIALPPEVAAVSYLLKADLHDKGMVPGKDVELSYHRSHMSCMQQVVLGKADACGTAAAALRFFTHKMNTKLKIVAKTTEIPHTLFAIHPRVSNEDREKVLQAILTLADTEEGQVLLKRGRLKPFVPIKDKDYDVVRAFDALIK